MTFLAKIPLWQRTATLLLALCSLLASPTTQAQTPPASPIATIQKNIHLNRYSLALQQAEAHLAVQPQDTQAQFLRGVALSELGRTTEAIRAFEQLIEANPEMPEPYNNLAVLQAQQGELEQAKQSLEMAVRTKPDYALAYENLGDIYARLASRHYQRAQALDQDNLPLKKKLSSLETVVSTAPQVYKPVMIPAKKTSTLPF